MNIKTSDRNLYITNVLSKADGCENFICTDLLDKDERRYLIVKLSVEQYSGFIQIIMQIRKIPDFKDCFSQNGFFYAMFYFDANDKLSSKIEKCEYSLTEKLEIMKNLIEKILLLNVPNEILNVLLNYENVTVDDALTVRYNYCMNKLEYCSFGDIQKKLNLIAKMIFKEEIKHQSSQILDEFCNNLYQGEYTDMMGIYTQFMKVYDRLIGEIHAKKIVADKRILILGKTVREIMKILKTVICYILIITAVMYFFIVLLKKDDDKGNTYYKQIGNLNIKEYSEAETEGK